MESKVRRSHPEQALQRQCVAWFRYQYPEQYWRLHMNHNESKSARDGSNKKSLGLLPGVADLEYIREDGVAVFIELKTTKGKQSGTQKLFQQKITDTGAKYSLVRSLDDFIKLIEYHQQ